MAPPSYSDLGKQSKDVFDKGYHFGLWKLNLKTKTNSGVEFTTAGQSNQESGKVFGSLETKYKIKEHGLVFSEKWNTDNTLLSEISIEDKLAQGLKLSFNSSFAPQTGSKTGQIKTSYSHDYVRLDGDMNIDLEGPIINGSAVFGYQGWLFGGKLALDTKGAKIKSHHFGIGYKANDVVIHTNVNDGSEFGGSVYHKVGDKCDVGVNLTWTAGSNVTKFGVGGTYSLDKNASVRTKVNNNLQFGLGYEQKLRDGVTLTLSTLIEGKQFNSGPHKIGLALDLEA